MLACSRKKSRHPFLNKNLFFFFSDHRGMNVAALTMNDPERLTVASHSHSAPAPNAGTLTTESAAHHHHQHQHHHHQILENVNEVSIQPSASQSTSNEDNHASLNSDGVSF